MDNKFEEVLDESSEDDEEDRCTKQWKRANVTLRDLKKTVQRLKNSLVKKEEILKETEEEVQNKNRLLARCEKAYQQLSHLLDAERSHFSREKAKYFEELTKMKEELASEKGTSHVGIRSSFPIYRSCLSPHGGHVCGYENLCDEVAALKAENSQLRSLIEAADEQNEQLCERFLRMKEKKEEIFRKCWEIEEDFMASLQTVMRRFNELREEVNVLMDTVIPVDDTEDCMIRLARSNHDLAYENSYLRLELQCLRSNTASYMHNRPKKERRMTSNRTNNRGTAQFSRRKTI